MLVDRVVAGRGWWVKGCQVEVCQVEGGRATGLLGGGVAEWRGC